MNRWTLIAALTWTGLQLAAAGNKPILDYDFTGDVVVRGGKYAMPVMTGSPKMVSEGRQAIRLDGKRDLLTVPKSENLSMKKGGTLFAEVFLADDGRKAGTPEAHDMIFFKPGDFLFGRTDSQLYFNVGSGKNWLMSSYAAPLPSKKWVRVAVTVEPKDKDYTVKMFMDGKKVFQKTYKNITYPESVQNVTIGKGWGGPWYLKGDIAKVRIYDTALDENAVAQLK